MFIPLLSAFISQPPSEGRQSITPILQMRKVRLRERVVTPQGHVLLVTAPELEPRSGQCPSPCFQPLGLPSLLSASIFAEHGSNPLFLRPSAARPEGPRAVLPDEHCFSSCCKLLPRKSDSSSRLREKPNQRSQNCFPQLAGCCTVASSLRMGPGGRHLKSKRELHFTSQ